MNATEIISKANSLPELPTVIANNMLYAQAYVPTAAERAAIVARAEFFEGMGMSRKVNVNVADSEGLRIGHLEFNI